MRAVFKRLMAILTTFAFIVAMTAHGTPMVNFDPGDPVQHECTHALTCVTVLPKEGAAQIADVCWDKADWKIESPELAGIEVPPDQRPPIVERGSS